VDVIQASRSGEGADLRRAQLLAMELAGLEWIAIDDDRVRHREEAADGLGRINEQRSPAGPQDARHLPHRERQVREVLDRMDGHELVELAIGEVERLHRHLANVARNRVRDRLGVEIDARGDRAELVEPLRQVAAARTDLEDPRAGLRVEQAPHRPQVAAVPALAEGVAAKVAWTLHGGQLRNRPETAKRPKELLVTRRCLHHQSKLRGGTGASTGRIASCPAAPSGKPNDSRGARASDTGLSTTFAATGPILGPSSTARPRPQPPGGGSIREPAMSAAGRHDSGHWPRASVSTAAGRPAGDTKTPEGTAGLLVALPADASTCGPAFLKSRAPSSKRTVWPGRHPWKGLIHEIHPEWSESRLFIHS